MATTTATMLIPEVFADLVETKLGARVTLLPLAVQDDTLVGQPGDTLQFPAFRYVGKADEIAENGLITPALLTSFSVAAKVKKFAKAVQLTDEVRLSGFGDPVGEAASQLAHSIDHATDDALYAQLNALSLGRIYPVAGLSASSVADALTLFGDDLEGPKVLLVDPAGFAALRKDSDYIRASDLGQRAIFSGVVGEIWGCQIVVSTKIAASAALGEFRYYIIKPGALRLVNKQGTFVEVQREPEYMRDTIYASKHVAAYLYDDSRAVALSVFSAVQVLDAGTAATIHTEAGAAGKTKIVIPEAFAPAPATCKWVYSLDTSATKTVTFGTALSGMTNWVSSATEIAVTSETYAHVVLVDAANKPLKIANVAVVKG